MPLIRMNDKLVYFAHVPKCGGKSVEGYLRRRFGSIALVEPSYLQREPHMRWSQTSPQHIDWESFLRFFPEDWISESFCIVRHPLARVKSAFDYQFSVAKTLDETDDITSWFNRYVANAHQDVYKYDHHLRPQSDLIPADAKVFHLELGLDAVVPYLDEIAGNSNGDRTIFHENKRRTGSAPNAQAAEVTQALKDAVAAFYKQDFDAFGYDINEKLPVGKKRTPAPDLTLMQAARRKIEGGSMVLKKVKRKVLKR